HVLARLGDGARQRSEEADLDGALSRRGLRRRKDHEESEDYEHGEPGHGQDPPRGVSGRHDTLLQEGSPCKNRRKHALILPAPITLVKQRAWEACPVLRRSDGSRPGRVQDGPVPFPPSPRMEQLSIEPAIGTDL